eukprot:TRINITY_DN25177_c0_g1_i1.p1 TRINITY_DN25177_c0_g1~~TRINITY_DN25177_c0_g1_i1.p1  ORF type:complete len:313 (-),score=71.06 TRINITY_DN25177_c0_g1_i1:32-970(-)
MAPNSPELRHAGDTCGYLSQEAHVAPAKSELPERPGCSPADGPQATLKSVAPSAMPRKQARINSTSDVSIMEGVDRKDRARVLTEEMIRRREERCKTTRCSRCWFPIDCGGGTSYCVCARMPALSLKTRTRFMVYMHPRDWYNAGDDAKILLSAAPDASEIFVYGRPGDDEKLKRSLASCSSALLLFPDASAISVDEFLQQRDHSGLPETEAKEEEPETGIVVIDGTWNNVKQMQKHFSKEVAPHVPHVKLEPKSLSVYARTQTRKDGISSVEAVALLLRELGDAPEVCDELVRYITVNNEALRLKPTGADD